MNADQKLKRGRRDASSLFQKPFEVLRAIARIDRPVGLNEIAPIVKLPKTTVYRILLMLVEANMLLRERNGHEYFIAPQVSMFAREVLLHSSLRAARQAVLQRLVDEIGETCNFTMRDGYEVLYVDRVEAKWPLRLQLQAGSKVPIYCTASGKLLLSYMPTAARKRLWSVISIKRFTEKTITDVAQLEREFKTIRKRGYSVDDEGFLTGLISVAVPVKDAKGQTFATVAFHAPNARLPLSRAVEYVPLLQGAATALSRVG